jgi:methylated-DNA-[protein]-cysteine S-methyltransferase
MTLATRAPTKFESRVYVALREIPRGRVVTYATLARHLECRSAQAVGQALKRNPLAPEVPCHRVIRTDGSLGGYSGKVRGVRVERKRRILEEEGVPFDEEGHLLDAELLWSWQD